MMENEAYLKEQIITYIGNKRKLLPYIEKEIEIIQKETGKYRLVCGDLFSGSGIVARLLKRYSTELHTNDMEDYSNVINDCYLTNNNDINWEIYHEYRNELMKRLESPVAGIITETYAPVDENNIKAEDRVFYTRENAMIIDTAMQYIQTLPAKYQKLFIGPLLHEASVHVNTSGVFKGFYKDKNTKIGKFGGAAENCLERIKGKIEIPIPVLSNYPSKVILHQGDTNKLAKELKGLDIVYLDPPYNQHPYGSNYFMLNTICNYKLGDKLSKVSGIPDDWNKSAYNKKSQALKELSQLVSDLDAKYIIISYNSEGFIPKEDMVNMLKEKGTVKTIEIEYNAFRGSRNLANRDLYVDEYLFVLKKNTTSN